MRSTSTNYSLLILALLLSLYLFSFLSSPFSLPSFPSFKILALFYLHLFHNHCNLIRHLVQTIFPIDLVRQRMQFEGAGGRAGVYNSGIFGTFKHIMRSEGLNGLYRGILPEYYKVVPSELSEGIVFMTYEMKKLLSNYLVD